MPLSNGIAFRASLAAILAGEAPPPGRQTPATERVPAPGQTAARPTLRRGSKGPLVVRLQQAAGVSPADGDFGPRTEAGVRVFQSARGLVPDGIVGPATWVAIDGASGPHALHEAATGPLLKRGAEGDGVRKLQKRLELRGFDPGAVDGEFGAGTESAVRRFQAAAGLHVDGVVGPRTSATLG